MSEVSKRKLKYYKYINTTINNWNIIGEPHTKQTKYNKAIFINCRCTICGNVYDVRMSSILNGTSTMCSECAHLKNLEKANAVNKAENTKKNTYENNGNITTLIIGNNKILIDSEDIDIVNKYMWRVSRGYVISGHIKEDGFYILHRIILENKLGRKLNETEQCDHINRNKFDCRKSNLNAVTITDNIQNRGMFKNNTSGTTGVYYLPKENKWRASIGANGKKISLGNFTYKKDAINARKEAEMKYWNYINKLSKDGVYVEKQ